MFDQGIKLQNKIRSAQVHVHVCTPFSSLNIIIVKKKKIVYKSNTHKAQYAVADLKLCLKGESQWCPTSMFPKKENQGALSPK